MLLIEGMCLFLLSWCLSLLGLVLTWSLMDHSWYWAISKYMQVVLLHLSWNGLVFLNLNFSSHKQDALKMFCLSLCVVSVVLLFFLILDAWDFFSFILYSLLHVLFSSHERFFLDDAIIFLICGIFCGAFSLLQITVVEWIQINCDNACLWVIPQKAKWLTPLDNVNHSLLGKMHPFYFSGCSFLNPCIFCYPDGNGFKTSTMRLGADVIVFSRCQGKDGKLFELFFFLIIMLLALCFFSCGWWMLTVFSVWF